MFLNKYKILLPTIISILVLIVALTISIIATSEEPSMDDSLNTPQSHWIFIFSVILILFLFLMGQSLLIAYLLVVFRVFRYYLEFKVIASVVLTISIIKSLGELVNVIYATFSSTSHFTYLIDYIHIDSFWMNVVLRPIELFNVLYIILLIRTLRKLMSISVFLIILIIIPVVFWQIVAGSFNHIGDILFN